MSFARYFILFWKPARTLKAFSENCWLLIYFLFLSPYRFTLLLFRIYSGLTNFWPGALIIINDSDCLPTRLLIMPPCSRRCFFLPVQIVFRLNKISLWLLIPMIALPYILSFSLGVLTAIIIATGTTYLFYIRSLTVKKKSAEYHLTCLHLLSLAFYSAYKFLSWQYTFYKDIQYFFGSWFVG